MNIFTIYSPNDIVYLEIIHKGKNECFRAFRQSHTLMPTLHPSNPPQDVVVCLSVPKVCIKGETVEKVLGARV
jgi:hypothetical protein